MGGGGSKKGHCRRRFVKKRPKQVCPGKMKAPGFCIPKSLGYEDTQSHPCAGGAPCILCFLIKPITSRKANLAVKKNCGFLCWWNPLCFRGGFYGEGFTELFLLLFNSYIETDFGCLQSLIEENSLELQHKYLPGRRGDRRRAG